MTASRLQLMCVLPYIGKFSLDLRAQLRRTIEKNLPFCLDPLGELVTCLDSKILLTEKKSTLEQSTAINVVTARLKITEKLPHFHYSIWTHGSLKSDRKKKLKNWRFGNICPHVAMSLHCNFWLFWYSIIYTNILPKKN